MMISLRDTHHLLFGRIGSGTELLFFLSTRLDETGTGGESSIVSVGGAVATIEQWESLESEWEHELSAKGVSSFHMKEFPWHADYRGWSKLKQARFLAKLGKICDKNTAFRVSVGVESAVHAEIKQRMKGIKGFYGDSDYGLCLRYMMFWICEVVERQNQSDFKLSIMVEDGPYASGTADLYSRVSKMTGKWRPAKHAHRLNGFAIVPKGQRRSLEAADYLVSVMHKQLGNKSQRETNKLSVLLDRELLEQWYEGMIAEKAKRRAHGANQALSS